MRILAGVAMLVFAGFHAPPTGPRPPAPGTGRIVGKVVLSTAVTSRKMRFRLYTDPGPAAEPKASSDGSEMGNVVIYLDSVDTSSPRARHRTMAQRDETFEPHVVAVERGSTLEFLNDDPFFHNVFSLSGPKSFDLGRFPRGQAKTVRFDRTGVVKVFCHIHADMSAIVVVVPNPYFTSPDSTGQFELPDVPPGEYRVVAWHERTKAVVGRVRVTGGNTASIDFNIPVARDVALKD